MDSKLTELVRTADTDVLIAIMRAAMPRLEPNHHLTLHLTVDGVRVIPDPPEPVPVTESDFDELGVSKERSSQGFVSLRAVEQKRGELLRQARTKKERDAVKLYPRFFAYANDPDTPADDVVFSDWVNRLRTFVAGPERFADVLFLAGDGRFVLRDVPNLDQDLKWIRTKNPETGYMERMPLRDHALLISELIDPLDFSKGLVGYTLEQAVDAILEDFQGVFDRANDVWHDGL